MNNRIITRFLLSILLTLYATLGQTSSFRTSISVSPRTDILFSQGYVYNDTLGNVAQNTEELQKLYVKHGATEVYARIATNRFKYNIDGLDHSLQTAKTKARMAVRLGLPLNPELGVFNHYGDVLGQPAPDFSQYPEIYMPGPWMSLNLNQMKLVLIQYGALVAREIKSTGVTVNVWDIGNEINFGFAGVALGNAPNNVDPEIANYPDIGSVLSQPDGGLQWLKTHMWNYEAQLMRAVQIGILSVYPHAKFATHIATIPFSTVYTNAFYTTMLQQGAQIDVAGYSFYPSQYFDPPDMMAFIKTVVTDTVTSFNRPVFFAEQGYPAHTIVVGAFVNWNYMTLGYPFTEQGQAALLRDITAWGKNNGLAGIRPWAPDDIGLDWEPFALFKLTSEKIATARPALDAIQEGLAQSP